MDNVTPRQESAGIQIGSLSKEQVAALVTDKELSRLPPGSTEFQAALQKKFGAGTSGESATPAQSEGEVKKTEADSKPAEGKTTTDPEEKAKWSNAADRRIKEITKAQREAEAERDSLRARIAELEGKKAAPQPDTTPVNAKFEEPEPVWDASKFKDFTEFNKTWNRWDRRREKFEEQTTDRQKKVQDEMKSDGDKFSAAGKELETELGLSPGDFDHVMNSKEARVFSAAANYEVMKSELGARIAYEIVSNPDITKQFGAMTPPQQVKFIGRLEAKFEGQAKSKATTKTEVSKAKNPSTPLAKGNAGLNQGSTFTKGMSFQEYEARERERTGRARGY